MKIISLAVVFLLFSSMAIAEKKVIITVSATIVYNCQVIDEKNAKYCGNVDVQKSGKEVYIRY